MIEAEAEITRRYAWLEAKREKRNLSDAEEDPVYQGIYALEDFIGTTAPATLAGVAVKLRRLLDRDVEMEPNGRNDIRSLVQALNLLHEVVGLPTHPTRPVCAEDEWPGLEGLLDSLKEGGFV